MNKIIVFSIILFSTTVFSQNKFGVFSGINYSYFTNGVFKDINAENSIGLQIGALYEMELTEKSSFRPKLIFSQQGDRTKTEYYGSGDIDLNELDYKLSYINIPLDFKFWNKIYLIAGPQIGFLVSQKAEGVYVGKVKSNTDIGFNLGTGFKIDNVFVEFGVYQGLTTLLNYQYESTGSIVDVKNGFAKFTLGYNFN